MQADPIGRPIAVTDAKQGITKHVYGPFGELRRVELPYSTARETKQDAYGRATFDDDPDRGKTLREYNGFNEVIRLHDAAGRHYAFEHDAIGRLVQRSEGLNVSTYEYDTAANGVGALARSTGADGHIDEYAYDSLSRPKSKTLRLADGRTFQQAQSYDPFGRLETFGNGATTERVYSDETNTLETIFTMSGAKTLQSLRYDYDAQLNVKSRFDARQGKLERLRHDALNRITCTCMEACVDGATCFDTNTACDVDVHYDATGDITFKSDVGIDLT